MLSLRPATAADLPFVYDCLCDLEETTLDWTGFERVFRANLDNPAVWYVVAEEAGEGVGLLSCHVQQLLHHAGPVAEIQELYVRPDWRSRGVGEQLIAHLTEVARRENWLSLEVSTNRRRTRAHAFYERLGFSPTHLKLVMPLPSGEAGSE